MKQVETTQPPLNYGDQSNSGIDLSLIRRRLAMTSTERCEANRQALEVMLAFREAGRVRRANDAAKPA
jgi:hypothetical protein